MAEIVRRLRTTVGVEVYSRAFWLTFAVKAVLICLLVFGGLSGLQQFEGKVFLWRLVTYPIAALVVGRRQPSRQLDTAFGRHRRPGMAKPCKSLGNTGLCGRFRRHDSHRVGDRGVRRLHSQLL